MENSVIENDLTIDTDSQAAKRERISVSLRNLSRECRKEILSSHSYYEYWFGEVTKEQYIQLLQTNFYLRETIEELFDSLNGTFNMKNEFMDEEKVFEVNRYVTAKRSKSSVIDKDIVNLIGARKIDRRVPEKAKELIRYMHRVKEVYSVALLGILYMLEETVIYAGPVIARALDRRLELGGKSTEYLRGSPNQKADLWEFRRSLDLITDFQTQVNIVIASTMAYRMYQELIDPRSNYASHHSKLLH